MYFPEPISWISSELMTLIKTAQIKAILAIVSQKVNHRLELMMSCDNNQHHGLIRNTADKNVSLQEKFILKNQILYFSG